jgi:hypothetical protein
MKIKKSNWFTFLLFLGKREMKEQKGTIITLSWPKENWSSGSDERLKC